MPPPNAQVSNQAPTGTIDGQKTFRVSMSFTSVSGTTDPGSWELFDHLASGPLILLPSEGALFAWNGSGGSTGAMSVYFEERVHAK